MQKPKFTLVVITENVSQSHELVDFSTLATTMGVDELVITQNDRSLSDIIDTHTHDYNGHVVFLHNHAQKPKCEHTYLPRAVHPSCDTCVIVQDASCAKHISNDDIPGVSQVITLPEESRISIFSMMSVYFYDRHIKSITF